VSVAAPAKSQMNLFVPVIVAVLVLTLLLLIGGAFWIGRTMGGLQFVINPPPVSSTFPAPEIAKPIASPPPPPAPEPPAPAVNNEFALTGVVESPEESYAVINGTIVTVGEQIGHSTLVEIFNGRAKLRDRHGNEILLRVAR
jgi:hypothetical protein